MINGTAKPHAICHQSFRCWRILVHATGLLPRSEKVAIVARSGSVRGHRAEIGAMDALMARASGRVLVV